MTESSMTLGEYLRKINVDLDGDFLREGMRLLAQLIMQGEVTEQIGAARYERTPVRKTQGNGYWEPRAWDTQVGTIGLVTVPPLPPPTPEGMTASELGELRRKLFPILDKCEKLTNPPKEAVGHRIDRLVREGRLPRQIAALMEVIVSFRNVAEYENHPPTSSETSTLRNAWTAIEEWAKSMGYLPS